MPDLDVKDLLLADLDQFGESLWRNEEIGEKRMTFLVTLITAVSTALVALATWKEGSAEQVLAVTKGALAVLMVFGLMTYLRMLRRNEVSEEYKATLRHIRRTYARLAGTQLANYQVPQGRSPKTPGGYAELAAVIEALLLMGLLWFMDFGTGPSVVAGLSLAVALCLVASVVRGAAKAAARVAQAGAVAYRAAAPEPLFLLVTSRREPITWIFPKGHLEPGEDEANAAVRELREEAGVEGRAPRPLGVLSFRSGDEDVDVRYFLVEAASEGVAREGRQMAWLPLREAQRTLTHDNARALLGRAARKLGIG